MSDIPTWEVIGAAKRENLLSLIPKEWRLPRPLPPPSELPDVTGEGIRQYLTAREIEITETDAVRIVQKTSTGEWRSREVVEAFCHRAALAHQMISCLHEILFEAAIETADKLDEYFNRHKRPMGPLHGLPVSLKDTIHIDGVDTSMGYVGWLGTLEGNGEHRESQIVKDLRALGAVFYVKTSVPQGSFSSETVNHIIGNTPNPKNRNLVVGGSSGGEGGLLALRGSAIGLGTDIGGSIRVPAGWNGCFGLRPSTGRYPYEGIASTIDGQSTVPFVVGPMATSAKALTLMTMSILSLQPWDRDPLAHELPWKDDQFLTIARRFRGIGQKLSFGVMISDGYVNPQPPVNRAIHIAVVILKSLGHEVNEWKPPSHVRAFKLWMDICLIDGGHAFHRDLALSGEPPTYTVFGSQPSAQVDATTVMQRNIAIRKYRKEYMNYWNSTANETGTGKPVDAVLMPFAPFPAPAPGKIRYLGYTTVVNVLDYPASVIPVTKTIKEIDRYPADYTALNEIDQAVHDDYDAELLHSTPVGIQIVGRRLNEETVLAISEELGEEISKRSNGFEKFPYSLRLHL